MDAFSQKGKIFYDRREWCIRTIIPPFILSPFVMLWLISMLNETHEHHKYAVWMLYLLAVITPLIIVRDNGSMHIIVTDSKLIFRQGFFFMRRTIHYNEIFDIAFKSANSTNLNRHYGRKRFCIGSTQPEIIVNLRDGDHFIVGGSRYAEEILSAIKLARPHINID